MSARQMNATRQMHKRMFVVMTSALLLFACSKDSHDSSASDRVDVDLDIALAGISRDKIQSHLNFLSHPAGPRPQNWLNAAQLARSR